MTPTMTQRPVVLRTSRSSCEECKRGIAQALEGLLADAEQLAGSVHSTAELSERVSKVCSYWNALSLTLMHYWPGTQSTLCYTPGDMLC